MPPRHVQVPAPPGPPAAQPRPALRRRPRQPRAQASSDALQQAFVQVWLERGYARTTIREIAAVAGVSVGTFYEYCADKQSLAALCIHRHVQAMADRLRAAHRAAGDAARVPGGRADGTARLTPRDLREFPHRMRARKTA